MAFDRSEFGRRIVVRLYYLLPEHARQLLRGLTILHSKSSSSVVSSSISTWLLCRGGDFAQAMHDQMLMCGSQDMNWLVLHSLEEADHSFSLDVRDKQSVACARKYRCVHRIYDSKETRSDQSPGASTTKIATTQRSSIVPLPHKASRAKLFYKAGYRK